MSNESKTPRVVEGTKVEARFSPMPVLRLISRPCAAIVDGRLAIVLRLLTATP